MDLPDGVATKQLDVIREKSANNKIIFLTDQKTPDLIHKVIKYRISGLLPIDASYALYTKAIVAVCKGEFWLPHWLLNQMLTIFSSRQSTTCNLLSNGVPLTHCEQKIVDLLMQGLSNKLIAQQLTVSPETVKKHLKAVFEKFGVHSRSQLIAMHVSLWNRFT